MSDYRILFALRANPDPWSERRFMVDMFHCGVWDRGWEHHLTPKGRVKSDIKKAYKLMIGKPHPLEAWMETMSAMDLRTRFASDLITPILCIQSEEPMEAEQLERVINCMSQERYHEFVDGASVTDKYPRMKSI